MKHYTNPTKISITKIITTTVEEKIKIMEQPYLGT